MTLPSSGTITLYETQNNEFGGPGNLLAYYRGGIFVPNTSNNLNIPTSGTIRLENFYGASAVQGLTVTGNLTSVEFGTDFYGYSLPSYGNTNPSSFSNFIIYELFSYNGDNPDVRIELNYNFSANYGPGQNAFSYITINGATYYTNSVSNFNRGTLSNGSTWLWNTSTNLLNTGTYPFTIKY